MTNGEYGVQIVLGTGFTMTGSTSLQLVFTAPDGTTFTRTNPAVAIVNAPYGQPAPFNFLANQYLTYTTVLGDVTQAGLWTVRGHYLASGVLLISTPANFTVNA